MKPENNIENTSGAVAQERLVQHSLPDIATHFAQALADGRLDVAPSRRAITYGRHEEKRRPSDPLPENMKFGGVYPMDYSSPNASLSHGDGGATPTTR
jgi:hypothetical protein